MTPAAPLLELRSVQVRFPRPGSTPLRALEDIRMDVRPDEILCLLGPSGAGKSTLLRVIAGLVEPAQGEVRLKGTKLEGLNHEAAMVFQNFALVPWMTVDQNVKLVLEARGFSDEEVSRRAGKAIQKVGLEGFEEAYPRELARGSKQRVGLARAFAVEPLILLMDEPFSQVDPLTAEALRAEIHDIWHDPDTNPSAIVMVSHSIREAVLMADRIGIMSGNPGTLRTLIDVPLPRPRDSKSPAFMKLVDQVHDAIASAELPDIQVTTVSSAIEQDEVEPLPHCQSGHILGLLEFLGSSGGRADLFQVASHNQVPFERVLPIVKAAEMLDFVDTPRRMVELTPLGKRFVDAGMDERKDLWKAQLLELKLFRVVKELMEHREGELSKEELEQELVTRLPMEDPEHTFETLVAWSRFGELFAYREERGVLTFE
jgi:NitT/TauT family transport system ATP-binding protein